MPDIEEDDTQKMTELLRTHVPHGRITAARIDSQWSFRAAVGFDATMTITDEQLTLSEWDILETIADQLGQQLRDGILEVLRKD